MNKSELKQFVKTLYPYLDDSVFDRFMEHTDYVKYTRGTKLIDAGKKHPYFYFIITGSVKSYYLKDARKVCLWFAFRDEIIGTMKTLEGAPSNETIELLEDSEFIRFKTEKIKELAETNLAVSHLMIELIAEHAAFLEERLYQLLFTPSKERYQALLKAAPEVLQKVSLTDIASYLGVNRETLSRIRAQK